MLAAWPERAGLGRDILVCEHEGDRITHDIIQRLNQTFVTPIDREDIYELASALDDIVDLAEEVADFMGLYKVEAPMEQSQRLAQILLQASRMIAEAMPRMRKFGDISHSEDDGGDHARAGRQRRAAAARGRRTGWWSPPPPPSRSGPTPEAGASSRRWGAA